jgi:8-oxo-dGTP pyrophosphatase MutT (NUDIX family)
MVELTLDLVRRALEDRRPGRVAHVRMVPRPRPGDIPPPPPAHPLKEAGVLVLLYHKNDELFFVLTRRTETVAMHKGQISLPGGAREGAETLAETAVRETAEELGIAKQQVDLLGTPLTPIYIPVSEFWVTAFVGYSTEPPFFRVAPAEVVEIIETPLRLLIDDTVIAEEEWQIRGDRVRVPYYRFDSYKVWGATAMMLSEFSALLQEQIAGPG